jgi:TraM recognition site of TraD and TraG
MVSRRPALPAGSSRWRFHPRTGGVPNSQESAQFRTRLLDGIRSGQGLRPELELLLTSGAAPELAVCSVGPGTTRWFSRVLAEVYSPHQWQLLPAERPGPSTPGAGWKARRIHEWPEPIVPEGASSLLEGWVATLRATPPGARLRIRARPAPARSIHWWTGPPVESDRTTSAVRRTDRPTPLDRARTAGTLPIARPLFWWLAVDLEIDLHSPAARTPVPLGDALSAASRTVRGNGLVFHRRAPPSWGPRVGGGTVIASIDEWASLWPDPYTPIGGDPPSPDGVVQMLPLGRTNAGTVVGPLVEPDQGRHLVVMGQTGMGKSSLLIALARRSLSDFGGVVFDPLGDTVRSIREELDAPGENRCLWISPDAPGIELNALEGIGGGADDDPVRSERRLNDLVHALRRVRSGRYSDSGYWGPRLEEMVTRALRAASALPDGTLDDAHTLLSTSTRLGRPIPAPAVEVVRELGDRIRDRPEDADGARRLLHEVVRSPVLSRMLASSRPTLRARDLVGGGQVVLISGDAARVGESTARYLLSVLLALVWSELLARPENTKTFVVLDEAQWFSHESLAEMLRLGRRKNVHVVLATQAIASLPENVAEAVWTNVSDIVAFRGSPEEAREMARVAPGVTPEALLSLPRGRAAVLIGKGERVHWLRTARIPRVVQAPRGAASHLEESNDPVESPALTLPTELASEEPEPSPSPVAGDREGLRRVFDELARAGSETPEMDPFAVDLSRLRQQADPGGDWVRRAGSALARCGALVRVDRTGSGRRWMIDRARFQRLEPEAAEARSHDTDSPAPQSS